MVCALVPVSLVHDVCACFQASLSLVQREVTERANIDLVTGPLCTVARQLSLLTGHSR